MCHIQCGSRGGVNVKFNDSTSNRSLAHFVMDNERRRHPTKFIAICGNATNKSGCSKHDITGLQQLHSDPIFDVKKQNFSTGLQFLQPKNEVVESHFAKIFSKYFYEKSRLK